MSNGSSQSSGTNGKILVTGGAGFIGSHLVDSLLADDYDVVVLDNLSTGHLGNLDGAGRHPNFRFVQGSVTDETIVDELMHECDSVIHLAAAVGVRLIVEEPLRSFTTNVRGSEVVIGAAHRYRRTTLVASTSEVYGKNPADALHEDADRVLGPPQVWRWAYSVAKSVDEILAYLYHSERGLPTVVMRFFNTVGPRQSASYGMVIPRLVRQALAGEPITVYGDGLQTRCFCHVQDTVRAVRSLMEDDRAIGEAFNIGAGKEISMLDLARKIVEMSGSSSDITLVSYDDAFPKGGFEDMRRRVPDTTKIESLLGWTPEKTLDDILCETIEEALLEERLRQATLLT
jgi:UDP-glucose 4-epimerase